MKNNNKPGEALLAEVKKEAKELKAPKTIKLTTLAIIVVSIIAGFVSGIFYQDYIQAQIKIEAKNLVKSLK